MIQETGEGCWRGTERIPGGDRLRGSRKKKWPVNEVAPSTPESLTTSVEVRFQAGFTVLKALRELIHSGSRAFRFDLVLWRQLLVKQSGIVMRV